MLAVHHRALHEKLDRMLAGGQVEAITAWQQEFVSMHFRMLEEKRQLVQTREWSVYSGSMVKSTVVVGQQ